MFLNCYNKPRKTNYYKNNKKRQKKYNLIKTKKQYIIKISDIKYKYYDTRDWNEWGKNKFKNINWFGNNDKKKLEKDSIECNILLNIIQEICGNNLPDTYEVLTRKEINGKLVEKMNIINPPNTVLEFKTPTGKKYNITSLQTKDKKFDGFLIKTEKKNLLEFENIIETIKHTNKMIK